MRVYYHCGEDRVSQIQGYKQITSDSAETHLHQACNWKFATCTNTGFMTMKGKDYKELYDTQRLVVRKVFYIL